MHGLPSDPAQLVAHLVSESPCHRCACVAAGRVAGVSIEVTWRFISCFKRRKLVSFVGDVLLTLPRVLSTIASLPTFHLVLSPADSCCLGRFSPKTAAVPPPKPRECWGGDRSSRPYDSSQPQPPPPPPSAPSPGEQRGGGEQASDDSPTRTLRW